MSMIVELMFDNDEHERACLPHLARRLSALHDGERFVADADGPRLVFDADQRPDALARARVLVLGALKDTGVEPPVLRRADEVGD